MDQPMASTVTPSSLHKQQVSLQAPLSTTQTTTSTADANVLVGSVSEGGLPRSGVADALTGDASSNRNFATSRKVQKLLDITVNDNFRELVLYMNDAVPDFLQNLPPCAESLHETGATEREKTPHTQQTVSASASSPSKPQPQHGAAVISSIALRTALESRVVDLHRYFLQEWSVLNDVFEESADLVEKLQKESETLQATLDAHAARAEEFVGLMTSLQAELSLVQQREREMQDFQGKYHFGAEEQRVLEEGQVDTSYLDLLKQAQRTHRKCRELLLSREHYQSAAAVMDITYSAIMKGTEKVARYLMSVSATSPGATSASVFGSTGVGGDIPELSSFYLRCAQFLREESPEQWVAVMEEVARLRRAAVLRQYFHLMTTGSVTTATGTYRAGYGNSNHSLSSSHHATGSSASVTGGGGSRPLEAEIGNPVFFFSSLFAWLHQVIVDEDDFFTTFFTTPPHEETEDIHRVASNSLVDEEYNTTSMIGTSQSEDVIGEPNEFSLTKTSLLNSVFEVLCKHIQGVLDGVLERFLRSASNFSEDTASGGGVGGTTGGGIFPGGPSGPIGLTGGIARLISAATGRPASSLRPSSSGIGGRAARYQHVMSRSQQEALVASTLASLTGGLRTAHMMLQLFTYYSYSTFTALLGREAALTRLVADDAKLQLLRVYHTIAKQLMEYALDSVTGVLSRSAVLRRLASSAATAAEAQTTSEFRATPTSGVPIGSPNRATYTQATASSNANASAHTNSSGIAPSDSTATNATVQETANVAAGPAAFFVTEFLFDNPGDEDGAEALGNEGIEEVDFALQRPISLSSSMNGQNARASSVVLNRSDTWSLNNSTIGSVCGGNSSISTPSRTHLRAGMSKHKAQAAELRRMLRTMILPTPPEVEEYLRVLQATMVEAEKQMEIMDSVRAMHLKSGDGMIKEAPEGVANSGTSHAISAAAYQEQFFMVLVQYVLSFSLILNRQTVVHSSLDEPCRIVIQLNTMVALQETLAPHVELLALSQAAAGHGAALSSVVPERIHQLAEELIASLSRCAVWHYFYRPPRGLVAGATAESPYPYSSVKTNTNSNPVTGPPEEHKSMKDYGNPMNPNTTTTMHEMPCDANTIVAQLSEVYGAVAASGRVYLPLVASLRSARLQEEVTQGVLKALCEVYEERYQQLMQLQPQTADPTAWSDLDPRKLRILLDTGALAAPRREEMAKKGEGEK